MTRRAKTRRTKRKRMRTQKRMLGMKRRRKRMMKMRKTASELNIPSTFYGLTTTNYKCNHF